MQPNKPKEEEKNNEDKYGTNEKDNKHNRISARSSAGSLKKINKTDNFLANLINIKRRQKFPTSEIITKNKIPQYIRKI